MRMSPAAGRWPLLHCLRPAAAAAPSNVSRAMGQRTLLLGLPPASLIGH